MGIAKRLNLVMVSAFALLLGCLMFTSLDTAWGANYPDDDMWSKYWTFKYEEGDVWIGTDGEQMTSEEASQWEYGLSSFPHYGETYAIVYKYTGKISNGNIKGYVPSIIDGHTVKSMSGTFEGCEELVNAPVIPDTVEEMNATFADCTALVNAPVIPSRVHSMGSTFYGCTSLENPPELPESLSFMGRGTKYQDGTNLDYPLGTFGDCTSLKEAPTIPDDVYNMSYAFANCTNITTIQNFPSSISILKGTFQNCSKLKSVPEIPSSVTDMEYAFYGSGIEAITGNLPNINNVNFAFENCSRLKTADLTFGNNIYQMRRTFKGCSSLLKTPTIPDSVSSMDETFMNCTSLKEVTNISANWESLDKTFANCTSLTTPPTIPDVQIDNFENRDILTMKCTFDNCQGIYKKVKAPNDNRLLESYDSIILSDAGKMVAISVEGLYCGCTEVVDPSPDEGEDEEQDPTTPSNPGETSGNMSIYGTVQPITMIDVTVPLTIQFTIESDRTFTGPDSIEIKSNCPSPLDVNLYGVNKDDSAPSLVAPDTHSDDEWNNLSRSETLASIALMLDNTSLSSTGSTLGRIDSAFQSEKALDLDLSAKYGKAWDNSEDLVFTYNVVFEFAMP